MNKAQVPLRLLEHYTSTQGEGPRVGVLTQFVRFAGCNLSCPLWPCDSQFAIDPKLYRDEQKLINSWELSPLILNVADQNGARNVCLTGGEPFLQNNEALLNLVNDLKHKLDLEVFTNGTFEIPDAFFEAGLAPVMDWKLPGSGEKTWVASRARNVRKMNDAKQGVVKFTIGDQKDFEVAIQVFETMIQDLDVPVYAGPVWKDGWGATEVVNLITEFKVPWILNVQVHQFIYGVNTRGT